MVSIQNVVNTGADTVLNCGAAAGIGYLTARVFMSSLNPVHAAVVSAISVLVSKVANPVFDYVFTSSDTNKACKFLGNVLNITASVAASAGIASAIGFPVSFSAFLCLNAITIVALSVIALGLVAVTEAGPYFEEISNR
jgi:ABC-type polysaccharide/polyol phosphate export permease